MHQPLGSCHRVHQCGEGRVNPIEVISTQNLNPNVRLYQNDTGVASIDNESVEHPQNDQLINKIKKFVEEIRGAVKDGEGSSGGKTRNLPEDELVNQASE